MVSDNVIGKFARRIWLSDAVASTYIVTSSLDSTEVVCAYYNSWSAFGIFRLYTRGMIPVTTYTQSIFSTPILLFTHTTETLVVISFSIILHWTFFSWFIFWTPIFVCFWVYRSVDLETFCFKTCLRTGSHTSSCWTICLGSPNIALLFFLLLLLLLFFFFWWPRSLAFNFVFSLLFLFPNSFFIMQPLKKWSLWHMLSSVCQANSTGVVSFCALAAALGIVRISSVLRDLHEEGDHSGPRARRF